MKLTHASFIRVILQIKTNVISAGALSYAFFPSHL